MNKIQKIILKISGMHCVSCSLNIDGELEDTPGVIAAQTSYPKSQTSIEFDPQQVTIERLQTVIQALGYTTQQ